MRVLLALVIAGLATGATPLPARAQQDPRVRAAYLGLAAHTGARRGGLGV